jgi:hypothetical protein
VFDRRLVAFGGALDRLLRVVTGPPQDLLRPIIEDLGVKSRSSTIEFLLELGAAAEPGWATPPFALPEFSRRDSRALHLADWGDVGTGLISFLGRGA